MMRARLLDEHGEIEREYEKTYGALAFENWRRCSCGGQVADYYLRTELTDDLATFVIHERGVCPEVRG